MTKITVIRHENGMFFLKVEGHSEYAEEGKDIVCSAISILVHSFAELCMDAFADDKVILLKAMMDKGITEINVCDKKGAIRSATEMLRIGFESLAENYPSNVQLLWGENDGDNRLN